jgi:6-phosphogluconolactonase (cycloisomerase 2 family)
MIRGFVVLTICLCLLLWAGCGSGNTPSPNLSTANTTGDSGVGNSGTGGSGRITTTNTGPRVLLGGTHQFSVPGSDVTWRVNRVAGGNAVVGTVSATGLYTAPVTVPLDPVVWISAVSGADASEWFMPLEVGALTGTRFAYVSSASDDSIQIFIADAHTGALQPTSVFSVGAGKGPAALALSPNGNFLYSLNRGTNNISIYAISPATGDLTEAATVATPNGPYAMVFSADGNFAYVSCDGTSTIAAYAVSLGTGVPTPVSGGSYAAGGGRIQSLAVSLDGKFLYATNRDTNQIIALAIATDGSLAPIAGSPFPAQPGLSSIVVNKGDYAFGGQSLYAGSNNGVEAYDRDPSSGAIMYLPSATQASTGKSPVLFRNTSDGLLVGVNPQGGGFSFAFDYLAPSNAGAHLLSGGPQVGTGTAPVAGAWLWNQNGSVNWLYVLNSQASASSSTGSIGVYQIDYTHGMVGPAFTIPTALHNPTGFVVTP